MQAASREKLKELQAIISKMPLEVCCVMVLPELGLQWHEVSRAVRCSRLPMLPASVARVLCKHAANSLTFEEIDDIIARLRLKSVATQERKWHVITLSDVIDENISMSQLLCTLPQRIATAAKECRAGRTMSPKVQMVIVDDLVYLSVQLVSDRKSGSVLYVASPPGEPVALVSKLHSGLLKAVVQALGYQSFEDANLFGKDVKSLLRVHDRANDANVYNLADAPEYNPMPVVTKTGIDFTNKAYNEQYVDTLLGPDPPLLTDLMISSTKPFFDPSRLEKTINLTVRLKSEDVARSLKSWVTKRALVPTSDFFQIFHKIKSNKFSYDEEVED